MPQLLPAENEFLKRVEKILTEHIAEERFGVSELAQEIGMSRSNLLRKIQKYTKLSASQYIRQVRLEKGMELLKETSSNVSEVAFQVGFSSTSYFIKCFREQYGYPPGEVGKHSEEPLPDERPVSNISRKNVLLIGAGLLLIIALILGIILANPLRRELENPEKSIAVIPFKNDSNDSTNLYFVNGLMEAILNNLQKIEDLRVISRTSVEQFRNTSKTIPEMQKELKVRYIVEGSGQKIGDQILLNVQLIDATNDKHLWAEQYSRKFEDVFDLQMEVSKYIAEGIQAVITPEEQERIAKIPTQNLEAYDYYLRAIELMRQRNEADLLKAIALLERATELDTEFAAAYAMIARSYYYLDIYKVDKEHISQINYYADKALFYDAKLPESLVAKGMYYIVTFEPEKAEPHLEKAMEYNPNSADLINFLSDFYTNYLPNTGKYLEYALKGLRLDATSTDSSAASFTYLHIANAFIQTGFLEQAKKYINISLDYNPNNLYSAYVKVYIGFAEHRNLEKSKEEMLAVLAKDSTRLDIMQEAGKLCYYLREYDEAYKYYSKFLYIKEKYNLKLYPFEDAKIGVVYRELGYIQKADSLIEAYKLNAEDDRSVYKNLSLAMYYAYKKDKHKSLEHLKQFSETTNFHYWVSNFLKIDPLTDNIRDLPEAQKLFKKLEVKFWQQHKRIRAALEQDGLLKQ